VPLPLLICVPPLPTMVRSTEYLPTNDFSCGIYRPHLLCSYHRNAPVTQTHPLPDAMTPSWPAEPSPTPLPRPHQRVCIICPGAMLGPSSPARRSTLKCGYSGHLPPLGVWKAPSSRLIREQPGGCDRGPIDCCSATTALPLLLIYYGSRPPLRAYHFSLLPTTPSPQGPCTRPRPQTP
jgi:hypothetical protein